MKFELIVDEKISLKLRDKEDAERVFELVQNNRAYLREWLPWVDTTLSPKNSEEYIAECKKGFEEKTNADFGVIYEGQIVGSLGFHEIDKKNERAEIGYWLSEDAQGKGIITACVKKLLEFGFEELGLNRIEIKCATSNIKSRAIPERLDFILEGTQRQIHKLNGKFQDGLSFSILKSEWLEKRKIMK